MYSAPRPQRHQRLHRHLLAAGEEIEARASDDRRQEQVPLHEREVVPDADAGPGAEREVRAARQLLLAVA